MHDRWLSGWLHGAIPNRPPPTNNYTSRSYAQLSTNEYSLQHAQSERNTRHPEDKLSISALEHVVSCIVNADISTETLDLFRPGLGSYSVHRRQNIRQNIRTLSQIHLHHSYERHPPACSRLRVCLVEQHPCQAEILLCAR